MFFNEFLLSHQSFEFCSCDDIASLWTAVALGSGNQERVRAHKWNGMCRDWRRRQGEPPKARNFRGWGWVGIDGCNWCNARKKLKWCDEPVCRKAAAKNWANWSVATEMLMLQILLNFRLWLTLVTFTTEQVEAKLAVAVAVLLPFCTVFRRSSTANLTWLDWSRCCPAVSRHKR